MGRNDARIPVLIPCTYFKFYLCKSVSFLPLESEHLVHTLLVITEGDCNKETPSDYSLL